jgi:thioredoxin-dependent peroxiredoxin
MSTEAPVRQRWAISRRRWLVVLAAGLVVAFAWVALDALWLSKMKTLKVGVTAPDFTAQAHNGETISLADFRGKKSVVLYFYPRDNTSVCTAQACSFRDSYEDFSAAGAVVIGVSGDSLERHQAFAAKKQLPFLLISDADGSLRQEYGVPNLIGLIPRRVTFVIDREGVVRHVFEAMFSSGPHIEGAKEIVMQLAQEQSHPGH